MSIEKVKMLTYEEALLKAKQALESDNSLGAQELKNKLYQGALFNSMFTEQFNKWYEQYVIRGMYFNTITVSSSELDKKYECEFRNELEKISWDLKDRRLKISNIEFKVFEAPIGESMVPHLKVSVSLSNIKSSD